jgi:hypothetical protein
MCVGWFFDRRARRQLPLPIPQFDRERGFSPLVFSSYAPL